MPRRRWITKWKASSLKNKPGGAAFARLVTLVAGLATVLIAGCAERPEPGPVAPPPAVARVQPPDWFHRQLAAARAAKAAHEPKSDRLGAQLAYDNVMHTACAQAALAGPGKYPARCDAILKPPSEQADRCSGDSDDPAVERECSD